MKVTQVNCIIKIDPQITHQVWDIDEEDIDSDISSFHGQSFSVNVNPPQGLRQRTNCIIHWISLLLCLWSSFCVISDNALERFLEFLRAFFLILWLYLFLLLEGSLHHFQIYFAY